VNETQRRDQFLSLIRNRMDPALRGADYDRCFNSVRVERPDLLDNRAAPTLAIANSFDPSQPRDEQGQWTAEGGGGGAAADDNEKIRRNASIMSWATQHGETGSRELAGIERLVHKKGLSLAEASKQVYAKRARRTRLALGDELYDQMKAEGKIKEGPPK